VALTETDKNEGRYVRTRAPEGISQLELADQQAVRGWMKGSGNCSCVALPPASMQSSTMKCCSSGGSFTHRAQDKQRRQHRFVESGVQRFGVRRRGQASALYQKRWKVEEFHKSLKSNAGLAKSPTRTVTTQNNHIFMSIYAVFKLECLKIKHKTNHFATRAKLFIRANQMAYEELQKLRAA